VCLDSPALTVEPENLGPARTWPRQPQEQADGGGLAGPVGPEVADDLALGDLQVEVVKSFGLTIALAKPFYADSGRRRWVYPSAG
jgi:hypothetical protein